MANGHRETNASYWSRNAFGALQGAGAAGNVQSQTGFTGASTPNASGGFTYLRNRWYDPQTGRFLTQDPIGLAGGVNLYASAGNNPISFSDPYGLLPIPAIIAAVALAVEVASAAYDVYQTVRAFGRSGAEGAEAVRYTLAGAMAPGPGNIWRRAESASTAVSTIRRTTPGETFTHYSAAEHASSLAGGMRPGSFVTRGPDLGGAAAKSGLALPHANAPNALYRVQPQPGTLVEALGAARPNYGQPGGLLEQRLPLGTGPGTVSGPGSIEP